MPDQTSSTFSAFLRNTPVLVVSIVLGIQIVLFYAMPRAEYVPNPPALKNFPTMIGPWQMKSEAALDTEVQDLLKADDTFNREYVGPDGELNAFVAYFKTARAGVQPHSPKVCLPGAGWIKESSTIISVDIPNHGSIPVNRYVVTHGEFRDVVLYWYQTRHSSAGDEYMARLYLMMEGVRYHRSDTALVRVIVPTQEQGSAAGQTGIKFIQTLYPMLMSHLWAD
jgi:EpsI family protein